MNKNVDQSIQIRPTVKTQIVCKKHELVQDIHWNSNKVHILRDFRQCISINVSVISDTDTVQMYH